MATNYTVKGGDTVSQILKNLGVSTYGSKSSWDAVAQANNLDSAYHIYPNQVLNIPDSLLGVTSTPAPTSTPTTTATTALPSTPTPTTSSEMAGYLNEYQDKLNSLENYDPFGDQTPAEAIAGFETDVLGIEGEAPVAPKYLETFQQLRENLGLDSIENGINSYKGLIREQESLLQQQRNTERGKTVRQGVIEGRVDQATRDRYETIDYLNKSLATLTDTANTAYNYIGMVMNFTQMDYNTAKEAYDTEFNRKMSVYQSLVEDYRAERDYQLDLTKYQQGVASTHLSMYMDLILEGSLNYDDFTGDQKNLINKLEVQAGLPVGFVSKVQIPKSSTIQSITQRTDPYGNVIADIIYVDPKTGAVEIQHETLGKTKVASSGGSSSTDKTIDSFWKSLEDPGVAIASSRTQANNYDLSGETWISREDLISRLTARYPDIERQDIVDAVYQYYSD